MNVIVPLAQGFEEIEAVTIIDVLRRAEINVTTVYLKNNPVKGSHDISVTADKNIDDIEASDFKYIILPGGMPGSKNLKEDDRVINLIREIYSRGDYAGAICAAPIVLDRAGVISDKKVTCYPGYENEIVISEYIPEPVVTDERIVTGRGAGCAIPFALELVKMIKGETTAGKLKNALQVYWI